MMDENQINLVVKYIASLSDEVSVEDILKIKNNLNVIEISKGDFLLNEGEICKDIYFTLNGYLRVNVNIDGEDRTRDITPVNSFVTALLSYVDEIPSIETIQAISDCTVISISKIDIENMYKASHKWERIGRLIMQDMFVNAQGRLYTFLSQTAEERYKWLIKNFPDLVNEVPLQYISEYLGIKQQSLSRLRRKMLKSQ
jgi:CRP-like cAMP-binding protein